MKTLILTIAIILTGIFARAQNGSHPADSVEKWNLHFQLTVIDQGHPSFTAAYSGDNSLNKNAEESLSITTTLFIGKKLWNGASLYFNPEIAGGSGISSARGIAGFTNGETFRIGSPAPSLYLGRLYYRQYIPLGSDEDHIPSGINQLTEYVPKKRVVITAGKIALSDLFDNNKYSHDPRTQFMNWSLMSNGAWDYPANTRGYTDAIAFEYISPTWEARVAGSLVPTYANGPDLDYNLFKANGLTAEIVRNIEIGKREGAIRFLAYRNITKAPAYRDVIANDPNLDVIYGKSYGGIKYGFGINGEQELNDNMGVFFRGSWNDGKTATWAFTEIDRSASAGLSYNGKQWHRPDDVFGFAGVVNGISADHRAFLNAGGYGFIIGDGKLTNYSTENIIEVYYSAKLDKSLVVSGGYQFVANPGYNADRGPVSVFSIRAHVVF